MVSDNEIEALHKEIQACVVCKKDLPLGPRPVALFGRKSKILIIGQAPGTKVHASGIPWDDPSGDRLRSWLGVDKQTFYDTTQFSLVPMGFCYPGKGKSGDLPPRKECAPLWHKKITDLLEHVELIILCGVYAQEYYLPQTKHLNLTQRVEQAKIFGKFIPVPHPSPRNRFWFQKHPWFEEDIIPFMREKAHSLLEK